MRLRSSAAVREEEAAGKAEVDHSQDKGKEVVIDTGQDVGAAAAGSYQRGDRDDSGSLDEWDPGKIVSFSTRK